MSDEPLFANFAVFNVQSRFTVVSPNDKLGAGIAIGVGVGLAIGTALGNPGAGLAIGIAFGIGIGATLQKKKNAEQDDA
jgi:hypothetical protein